jgi:hypothetical protein
MISRKGAKAQRIRKENAGRVATLIPTIDFLFFALTLRLSAFA